MTTKPTTLVTGGAGFIGSHMVDILVDAGYKVRIIDNLIGGREANIAHHATSQDVDFINADICNIDPTDIAFSDVSAVYHFAGVGDIVPSIERPIDYMNINVQGTVRMLEAARFAKVRKFVYAASSSCYGLADTPTTEAHKIDPQYPYALSKYQGEQAAFHWHRVYGLPVNSIRIFNAYGTRVRTTGAYGAVFGVFFKQKLAGKPFTVVGDGQQSRDFLYVTDVARAFLAAGETHLEGEIWNLGAGNPQTILRLVDLIGGDIEYLPKRPGEPDCTWADIRKITSQLDWTPTVSFDVGVSMMIENIENWQDAPLWDKNSIKDATETWFRYMAKGE